MFHIHYCHLYHCVANYLSSLPQAGKNRNSRLSENNETKILISIFIKLEKKTS